MKIIVDTGVWSRYLRLPRIDDSVCSELEGLIKKEAVQMLGCIRQELLSGAQPDERFARLRDYLRFFPNLPVDERDDETAAQCYNVCRRKGVQGGLFDLLICAQAIRHRLPIFTTDSDFLHLADHLAIKLHAPHHIR